MLLLLVALITLILTLEFLKLRDGIDNGKLTCRKGGWCLLRTTLMAEDEDEDEEEMEKLLER